MELEIKLRMIEQAMEWIKINMMMMMMIKI